MLGDNMNNDNKYSSIKLDSSATDFNGGEIFGKNFENDVFKEIFAKNLKKARIRVNFSQKQLAEKMDVPAPTISKYERGLMEPTLSTAKTIAKILNCTIDELAGHNALIGNFEAIAQYWHNLLFPAFSVSFNDEQQSFVITVLQETETIMYRFNAGKKLIIHHTAFAIYEEKIIELMDRDLYKNKKELAALYFARMIESIQISSGIVLPNKGETHTEE